MKKYEISLIFRLFFAFLACAPLQACTVVHYKAADGAVVNVYDLRLAGNAINLEASRDEKGNVVLKANRDQESPDKTVKAVGEAVGAAANPLRRLTP